jgi:phage recombination protein Bet
MTAPSTAVATRNGSSTALAIRPGQEIFSDKQRAALAVLGIRDATNADLAVFMHYCQKTGLDPFSRQIYMIMRREKQGDQWVAKQTIQVGIDGFRVIRDRIAARLGLTVEYEDTIWYDHDGTETRFWAREEAPAGARVVVVKDGRRFPGVVRTAAYMQRNRQGDPAGQWRTQPDHMIEKCAEAFALRRAFPHDLGGIYLEDEMPPAEQAPQRLTAADITARPRQQAPAPEVHDAEIVSDPPARDRAARPTGAMVGKLGKLLMKIRFQEPEHDLPAFLVWQTGRAEATCVEALDRDEVALVTIALDEALRGAEGDGELAASNLWAEYKAAEQDASAEASDA